LAVVALDTVVNTAAILVLDRSFQVELVVLSVALGAPGIVGTALVGLNPVGVLLVESFSCVVIRVVALERVLKVLLAVVLLLARALLEPTQLEFVEDGFAQCLLWIQVRAAVVPALDGLLDPQG